MEQVARTIEERNRRGIAWLVGRWWFWTLAIFVLFAQPLVRTFLREPPVLPKVVGQVPEFTGTREDGRKFGTNDLRGKVWVASFVALSDGRSADKMEETMHHLHRRLRKLGDAFRLVTFTIDPAHDSPAKLAEWSQAHKTNAHIWSYVAPDDPAFIRDTFHVELGGTADGARFMVVDSDLGFRGAYDPYTKDGLDALVTDVGLLVNNY